MHASAADSMSGSGGTGADLTLPVPGQPGSLTHLKRLTLQPVQGDAAAASIANVTSLVPDGLYQYGDRIEIGVRFTGAVTVSTSGGAPYLALDFAGERRVAQYAAGNGSDTLEFRYDVRYDDRHAGLNYTGTAALSDGGGSIKGASGLHADLELPPPGGRGSLSGNSGIVLGIAPPSMMEPVATFGTPASQGSDAGDGELRHPQGVAVSPVDGRIVVADTGNSRIQVFHPNGTFALGFGMPGSGAGGEFDSPLGVDVALDGRIVVADAGNNRIQVFAPDGEFDFMFTTHNREHALSPYDVAVDPGGRFVVPDHVFRPDGTYSHAPRNHLSFGYGIGVAASASGKVAHTTEYAFYVTYANGTAAAWSEYGGGVYEGQLYYPSGIAFDNAGRIVVADAGNNRIQVFHPNGTFAFRFDLPSPADGYEFVGPQGVDVSPLDGRIVVADTNNHRIQVFVPAGGDGAVSGERRQPAATAVTSPTPSGVYGEGDRILLNVHFTAPVFLSGQQPPSLALDTGAPAPRSAAYAGGNGTAILRFSYTVQPDDRTDDLEYAGADALAAPSGHSIAGASGSGGASLSLPAPGTPGSLSYSTGIRLDGGRPAAVNMTVAIEPGTAAAGPIDATDGGDGVRLDLDVTGISTGSGTAAFPSNEVVVATSFVTVSFPPGVAATSVPDSGLLSLHVATSIPDNDTVQDALAYAGSGPIALQTVVEVGGSDARVRFDMPVRISLEGQAGGRAFYIDGQGDGGAIVPIDRLCAADDADRVHRQLGGLGECQLDADGDKVIHTYHLTRFGTAAAAEDGAPPPSYHTCSARLGETEMDASAAPGGRSAPARQDLVNSGSLPFVGVGLEATPWHSEGSGNAAQVAGSGPPLPASATGVSEQGAGGGYAAIGNGTAVARGLGGGDVAPLWFRADLASHGGAPGDTLVQHVAYLAECGPP